MNNLFIINSVALYVLCLEYLGHVVWLEPNKIIHTGICFILSGKIQVWFELAQRHWLDPPGFSQSRNGKKSCWVGIHSGDGIAGCFCSVQTWSCK